MNIHDVKHELRERLFQELGPQVVRARDRAAITRELDRQLKRMRLKLNAQEQRHLIEDVIDDILGYGPIQALLDNPEVSEIMVNGPKTVFYEQAGHITESPSRFDNEAHLIKIIQKMAADTGRRIDQSSPTVDLTLENGARVNCVLSPIAVGGPFITIRKMTTRMDGIEELVMRGTLNPPMSQLLWACIRAGINIIFSGATGAGKTTLMQLLSAYIDEGERIITIEDTPELELRQRHVVAMQTRPPNIEGQGEITLRHLFYNSLRMRPNRIILGELRGAEAFDYLQALSSGHGGSLAVIHAASPEEVVIRLENLTQLAGVPIPPPVVRSQIAHGLQLIVQMTRYKDGVRRVNRISEIAGLDANGFVRVKDIFIFEEQGVDPNKRILGRFMATGYVPQFFKRFQQAGLDVSANIFRVAAAPGGPPPPPLG
ncbi:CpaF family protein [Myxococcota bacterium]|nr:CpaF family protein [Myxococcota bacterium]MBU1429863.1 CpaF family protein [Myxococcota bacterium]MBU1896459.1 CpaF family protein [Myxococcota bacterium]